MHAMRKLPVVPICRTSVPLRCRANQNDPSRVPHSPRGAFRDRHGRWARDAMDAMSHETNEHIADGEVVWSWRPKAGVKSVERSTGDGDNKAWSPGRSRISRNPLRRECRLYRLNLWFCRVLSVARGPWVQLAPGIPCALACRGRNRFPSGRTPNAPRRRRRLCARISVEGLDFPAASGSNRGHKSKRRHAV